MAKVMEAHGIYNTTLILPLVPQAKNFIIGVDVNLLQQAMVFMLIKEDDYFKG